MAGVLATLTLTLALSGAAVAATSTASGDTSNSRVASHRAAVVGTAVAVGGTWTPYSLENGIHAYCMITSFDAGKLFADDHGGVGKWKGSTTAVTMAYSASNVFRTAPDSFKATWISGDEAYRNGVLTLQGRTYGPMELVAGSDPWAWGVC
jgi:hypothetical protein